MLLLGEVHFVELPAPGRVRCIETGHEMPSSEKDGYGSTKKCRRALVDLFLSQRKPPLNVFKQNPTLKDKVICTLTGDVLNKSEDALWKHMNGKKFLRKLAQKEAEKNEASRQIVENIMDMGNPSDLKEDNNEMDNVDKNNEDMDNCEDNDGMDLEELAFWLPPDDQDHEDIHSDCSEETHENGCVAGTFGSTGVKRKAKQGASKPTLQKKKRKKKIQ